MPARSRHLTILRVTVGYLLTWCAGLTIWLIAIAVSQLSPSEGPEFDWGRFAMFALASLLGLIAAHIAWMVDAARTLAPYGHPWRARLTVIAPPVSLVLVVIARNESLVPWQLWPVTLVCVPAVGATWATARQVTTRRPNLASGPDRAVHSVDDMFTIEAVPADVAARLRAGANVVRVADESPGYPCRQCLRDAELGEELVLVSYDPFDTDSPYRSAGPIFLHRDDCADRLDRSSVPDQLARRRLSVRTFDREATMLDGRVVDGTDLASTLAEVLALPGADRAHIHNAGPGCFAAIARR